MAWLRRLPLMARMRALFAGRKDRRAREQLDGDLEHLRETRLTMKVAQKLLEHLHEARILVRAAERLLAVASLEERLRVVTETLQQPLGWDCGWVGLVDHEAGVIRRAACFGVPISSTADATVGSVPLDATIQNNPWFLTVDQKPVVVDAISLDATRRNILMFCIVEHRIIMVEDALNDPRYGDFRDGLSSLGAKRLVYVPILVKGETIGVIGLGKNKEGSDFTAAEVTLAMTFASLAGPAIENARLYEQANGLSLTDDLTGLYNRRFLKEQLDRELARSRRSAEPFSLLMIDVDKLKRVNDCFGHSEGDRLLQGVGKAICSTVRPFDVATRYGGDEFVVLLAAVTPAAAFQVAQRIARSIGELAPVPEEVQPTVSIGIACYPRNGTTQDELLQASDEAMLRAKRLGGNHICGNTNADWFYPFPDT